MGVRKRRRGGGEGQDVFLMKKKVECPVVSVRWLPSNHRRLPANRRRVPANRRRLPSTFLT